ncbi:MAG: tetratricopeptide repeat protein [Planctomycetaceae bacterium]|nr:tetratricopeptide repeat protein [Planctomycetaceae bacterium]
MSVRFFLPTLSLFCLIAVCGCTRAPAPDQLRLEARAAVQRGNVPQALSLLTKVIELAPKSAEVLVERGQLFLAAGDVEHAREDFDAAIAANPQQPTAWRERGRLQQQANKFAEAIADFTQSLALQPKEAGVLAQRGICHARLQHPAEAIADFDAALALNDRLAPVYQARGLAHLQLNHAAQAASDFHQADLLKAPLLDHAVPWCQALFAIGKQAEAERVATNALKEAPDNVELLQIRGRIRLAAKNYREAIADLDRVLTLDAKRSEALLVRAAAKNFSGQHAAARADYSQFLLTDPKHLIALGERARLGLVLNDSAAAKDDCDTWLAAAGNAGGDFARVMSYRALANYRLSDWTAAQTDARAALNADPERHDARCVWALAALLDQSQTDADKQVPVDRLTELLAAFPQDTRLLNLRAIAYLVLGEASLALADAEAAMNQPNPVAYMIATRAAAALRLKRTTEALDDLRKAPAIVWTERYAARRLIELLATPTGDATPTAGVEALQSGQWFTAASKATTALREKNADPRALLVRGAALAMTSNRELGLVDLQRGLGQLPSDDPLGRHLRALLAIEKNDAATALDAATNALRRAPDEAALYVAHLLGALVAGDTMTVNIDAELALSLDSDSLLAAVPLMGEWARPTKDPTATPLSIELLIPPTLLIGQKAAPMAEATSARRATAAKLLAKAGQTYYLASKYAAAVERYDLALSLEKQPEWFAGRAAAQYAQQKLPEAIADFTQAIALQPNTAAYHFNRANAYLSQQAFDLALADYSRVIELEPNNSAAYTHRATIYSVRKDEAKADADLERARKLKIEGK